MCGISFYSKRKLDFEILLNDIRRISNGVMECTDVIFCEQKSTIVCTIAVNCGARLSLLWIKAFDENFQPLFISLAVLGYPLWMSVPLAWSDCWVKSYLFGLSLAVTAALTTQARLVTDCCNQSHKPTCHWLVLQLPLFVGCGDCVQSDGRRFVQLITAVHSQMWSKGHLLSFNLVRISRAIFKVL